jgi:hypothetical protein
LQVLDQRRDRAFVAEPCQADECLAGGADVQIPRPPKHPVVRGSSALCCQVGIPPR